MAYFICEKQGRCCPHEFYDSIEQAISDSEDGVPCDHLIEVAPVRHGKWIMRGGKFRCSECDAMANWKKEGGTGGFSYEYEQVKSHYCPNCGAKMDGGDTNAEKPL